MSTNPSATPIEKRVAQKLAAPRTHPEALVRESLDDIALVIGGAAALHQLDDELVWTVIKRLDQIRVRLLRDLKGLTSCEKIEPGPTTPPRVHAAVEEFLVRNRAGMGE
jgi:hypothetical protein